MATSGTVSQTLYPTRKLVDRAYRLCKVAPELVTSEMLQTALDELYLLLSSMANQSVPLWAVKSFLLPMYYGVQTIECPVGTVDILNANRRTVTKLTGMPDSSEGDAEHAFDEDLFTACVQVTPAGYIDLALEEETVVTTVGIMPGATGTWDISLQFSDDGATWTSFASMPTFAAVDGEWQWFDYEGLTPHQYWRLQANGTTVLDVIELHFCNNPSAIPMARINKDDYYSLPNKTFKGDPVQFWFDRQLTAEIQVWPAPSARSQFQQIELQVHQQIEDVGTLRDTLAIPQRWFDAMGFMLAERLAMVTPEVKPDALMNIKAVGQPIIAMAWMEERDASPINLAPDISPYTR